MVENFFFSIAVKHHHYQFNIQFPIFTKLFRNVEGVTLNISVHQNCVISIAPPTGHRKSDKHSPT